MDVLKIILLISTLTPAWCLTDAGTDSECLECQLHHTRAPTTVLEHLSSHNFKNYRIERLVLVLYKINGRIQLYIPNILKQSTYPELTLDTTDFLQPANLVIFNQLFENNPSVHTPGVEVINDDINIDDADVMKRQLVTRLNFLNDQMISKPYILNSRPLDSEDSSEEAHVPPPSGTLVNSPLKPPEVQFKSDIISPNLNSFLHRSPKVLTKIHTLDNIQSHSLPAIVFTDDHVGNPFALHTSDLKPAVSNHIIPDRAKLVTNYEHYLDNTISSNDIFIERDKSSEEIAVDDKTTVYLRPIIIPHFMNVPGNHLTNVRTDQSADAPIAEGDQQHSIFLPVHLHNTKQHKSNKASNVFNNDFNNDETEYVIPIELLQDSIEHSPPSRLIYLPSLMEDNPETSNYSDKIFHEWFAKQVGHLPGDNAKTVKLRDSVKRILTHNHMEITSDGHLKGEDDINWGTVHDLNLKKLIVSDALGSEKLAVPVFYQSYLLTRGNPPSVVGFIPPTGDTSSESDESGPEKSLKQFFEDLKSDAMRYRIIGGDAAINSGAPLNYKGRSGIISWR